MPRIIADLARRTGEANWNQIPGSAYLSGADKARMIRETSEAYQRNLSERKLADLADEVFHLVVKRRDGVS